MPRLIQYNNKEYFHFQTTGNSARFIIPFAEELCIGNGYDIGAGNWNWALSGAEVIDTKLNGLNGDNLPPDLVDYIFSSHCLEHCDNWVNTLEHWLSRIRLGGVLFLYLPDYSQEYWRSWSNRKHKHNLRPEEIKDFLQSKGLKVFTSGVDLNNSFSVVAFKQLDPYGSHIPTFDRIFAKNKIKTVLEFGGGDHSTPYFIEKGCTVHSIEMQSEEWYNHIVERNPTAKVFFDLGKDGWRNLIPILSDHYDLIFVDGHLDSRPECANWAKNHTDIIVLHDTEAHCYGWQRLQLNDWIKYEDIENHPQTQAYGRNSNPCI